MDCFIIKQEMDNIEVLIQPENKEWNAFFPGCIQIFDVARMLYKEYKQHILLSSIHWGNRYIILKVF